MAQFRVPDIIKSDSDEALLRAFSQGEAEAFDKLYLRHKDGLYNFIFRSLGQFALAEEIAQEAWMAVIAQSASYKPTAAFRTWLYRIASNKVADFYRRKVNNPGEELDTTNEQYAAEQLEPAERVLLDQLLAALAELPEEQRITFVLHQEGFSHKKIAEITDVGTETVKSRLRYARSATRVRMELKA